jgi:peptide/nickel transport system permease protein
MPDLAIIDAASPRTTETGRRSTVLARASRLLRSYPQLFIGALVIILMLIASFALPLPYSPTQPDPTAILQPPSGLHWFGTDESGFDIFSRTIAAPVHELPLVIIGTLLSLAIGVPLGLLASTPTRLASVIMRALDVFLAFPLLILAIAIVVVTGNNIRDVVIAIVIINAPRFIRLVRTEALGILQTRFIEAAVASGCSPRRILFRHVLPNTYGVILVQSSLAASYAVIVIATLNFLGIGVSPPTPTWGSMIQSGVQDIAQGQWWPVVFPSVGLFIAVLSFNGIAGGFRMMFGGR